MGFLLSENEVDFLVECLPWWAHFYDKAMHKTHKVNGKIEYVYPENSPKVREWAKNKEKYKNLIKKLRDHEILKEF